MASPTDDQGAIFARLFGSLGATQAALPPQAPPRTSTRVPVRATAAALRAANAQVLQVCDVDGMQDQIHAILAASQRRSLTEFAGGPVASDGGIVIDSLSAVFVCSIINRIVGGGVLSRLARNSRPEDLVSTRALAALLVRLRSRRAA